MSLRGAHQLLALMAHQSFSFILRLHLIRAVALVELRVLPLLGLRTGGERGHRGEIHVHRTGDGRCCSGGSYSILRENAPHLSGRARRAHLRRLTRYPGRLRSNLARDIVRMISRWLLCAERESNCKTSSSPCSFSICATAGGGNRAAEVGWTRPWAGNAQASCSRLPQGVVCDVSKMWANGPCWLRILPCLRRAFPVSSSSRPCVRTRCAQQVRLGPA